MQWIHEWFPRPAICNRLFFNEGSPSRLECPTLRRAAYVCGHYADDLDHAHRLRRRMARAKRAAQSSGGDIEAQSEVISEEKVHPFVSPLIGATPARPDTSKWLRWKYGGPITWPRWKCCGCFMFRRRRDDNTPAEQKPAVVTTEARESDENPETGPAPAPCRQRPIIVTEREVAADGDMSDASTLRTDQRQQPNECDDARILRSDQTDQFDAYDGAQERSSRYQLRPDRTTIVGTGPLINLVPSRLSWTSSQRSRGYRPIRRRQRPSPTIVRTTSPLINLIPSGLRGSSRQATREARSTARHSNGDVARSSRQRIPARNADWPEPSRNHAERQANLIWIQQQVERRAMLRARERERVDYECERDRRWAEREAEDDRRWGWRWSTNRIYQERLEEHRKEQRRRKQAERKDRQRREQLEAQRREEEIDQNRPLAFHPHFPQYERARQLEAQRREEESDENRPLALHPNFPEYERTQQFEQERRRHEADGIRHLEQHPAYLDYQRELAERARQEDEAEQVHLEQHRLVQDLLQRRNAAAARRLAEVSQVAPNGHSMTLEETGSQQQQRPRLAERGPAEIQSDPRRHQSRRAVIHTTHEPRSGLIHDGTQREAPETASSCESSQPTASSADQFYDAQDELSSPHYRPRLPSVEEERRPLSSGPVRPGVGPHINSNFYQAVPPESVRDDHWLSAEPSSSHRWTAPTRAVLPHRESSQEVPTRYPSGDNGHSRQDRRSQVESATDFQRDNLPIQGHLTQQRPSSNYNEFVTGPYGPDQIGQSSHFAQRRPEANPETVFRQSRAPGVIPPLEPHGSARSGRRAVSSPVRHPVWPSANPSTSNQTQQSPSRRQVSESQLPPPGTGQDTSQHPPRQDNQVFHSPLDDQIHLMRLHQRAQRLERLISDVRQGLIPADDPEFLRLTRGLSDQTHYAARVPDVTEHADVFRSVYRSSDDCAQKRMGAERDKSQRVDSVYDSEEWPFDNHSSPKRTHPAFDSIATVDGTVSATVTPGRFMRNRPLPATPADRGEVVNNITPKRRDHSHLAGSIANFIKRHTPSRISTCSTSLADSGSISGTHAPPPTTAKEPRHEPMHESIAEETEHQQLEPSHALDKSKADTQDAPVEVSEHSNAQNAATDPAQMLAQQLAEFGDFNWDDPEAALPDLQDDNDENGSDESNIARAI